jgi:hypothetical protein
VAHLLHQLLDQQHLVWITHVHALSPIQCQLSEQLSQHLWILPIILSSSLFFTILILSSFLLPIVILIHYLLLLRLLLKHLHRLLIRLRHWFLRRLVHRSSLHAHWLHVLHAAVVRICIWLARLRHEAYSLGHLLLIGLGHSRHPSGLQFLLILLICLIIDSLLFFYLLVSKLIRIVTFPYLLFALSQSITSIMSLFISVRHSLNTLSYVYVILAYDLSLLLFLYKGWLVD